MSPTSPMLKVKNMPQQFIIVFDHAKSAARIAITPLLAYSGYLSLLQNIDISSKPVYAVIGAIVMAYLSYLAVKANAGVKARVAEIESKNKALDITESADTTRTKVALQLFDRGMLEAKEARESFKEATAEQRESFLHKIEEMTKESREYYDNKEKELRQSYHDRLNEVGKKCDDCYKELITLKVNLRSIGIEVSQAGDIILPVTLERKKI